MRAGRFVAIVACATALMAGEAQASTITVGSVFPPGSTATEFGQVRTFFNTALPEKGANLTSPVTGAIVRWRMQDADGGPVLPARAPAQRHRRLHGSGHQQPGDALERRAQTFTANLTVQAGDLIGIDPPALADKIGVAEVAGASYGFIFPPPFDGATVAPSGRGGPRDRAQRRSPARAAITGSHRIRLGHRWHESEDHRHDLATRARSNSGKPRPTSYQAESETQITASHRRHVVGPST